MITIILGIHPTLKNLSSISHQMLLWEFYDTLFKMLLGCCLDKPGTISETKSQ